MIRDGKNEENEATMGRFLNGLKDDRDVMELQEYVDTEDLLQKPNQVEQQLKRKRFMRKSFNNNNNSNWRDKVMKDKGVPSS